MKNRIKIYYFVSNKIKTINKILNWFNWAWVDTHAQKYMPNIFKEIIKALIGLFYTAIVAAFFVSVFSFIVIDPLISFFLLLIGVLMLPIVIKMLELPMKTTEKDNEEQSD